MDVRACVCVCVCVRVCVCVCVRMYVMDAAFEHTAAWSTCLQCSRQQPSAR